MLSDHKGELFSVDPHLPATEAAHYGHYLCSALRAQCRKLNDEHGRHEGDLDYIDSIDTHETEGTIKIRNLYCNYVVFDCGFKLETVISLGWYGTGFKISSSCEYRFELRTVDGDAGCQWFEKALGISLFTEELAQFCLQEMRGNKNIIQV